MPLESRTQTGISNFFDDWRVDDVRIIDGGVRDDPGTDAGVEQHAHTHRHTHKCTFAQTHAVPHMHKLVRAYIVMPCRLSGNESGNKQDSHKRGLTDKDPIWDKQHKKEQGKVSNDAVQAAKKDKEDHKGEELSRAMIPST
jgi:hypothetical protein